MSSQTQTPQQLYEAEKLRVKALERAKLRLEAELKQANEETSQQRTLVSQQRRQIDDLEVASEYKDEQLQMKDDYIQNLHSAFEDADRHQGSVENEAIKELRTKSQLLETQIKDLEGTTPRLTAVQNELLNAKKELSDANEQLRYLDAYNKVMRRRYQVLLAEAQNNAGDDVDDEWCDQAVASFLSVMQKDKVARTKLRKICALGRRDYETFENELRPVRQVAQPQSSAIPTTSPPARDISSRRQGNDGERVETPPQAALDDQEASEVTRKRQEEALEDYTTPVRKKTAHGTKGPKQTPLDEQLASFSDFAPLAFDGKLLTEPAVQAKKSRDRRQPSPSLPRAQASVTAPKALSPAGLHNRGSAFKYALNENKGAWTQPKSPLDSPTTSFALGASSFMAQVPVDHPAIAFVDSLHSTDRKPKPEPEPQTVTQSAADSTLFEFAHLEFWEETDRMSALAPQAEKIVESSKSPAELETLRLKDRQTLYSLAPH